MTLRLINSLLVILAGVTMAQACCCGGGCCQPCSNCFPCTNPPLLIKLPPTPPRFCAVPCCCGCCRPCCCGCCGGRKKRSSPLAMEKNCMKNMKKQTILCTNSTRNCKRCANLPKLEQKLPKTTVSNNKTDKKPKSRARRQAEMLGQMFGKSMGILPNQRVFNYNANPIMNRCDCVC